MSDDAIVVSEDNSDEISLIIRTADQTRKAEVTVPLDELCGELIQGAIENWKLDKDVDYSINNVTQNVALDPDAPIGRSGAKNGDTLEIQPVLVAGYEC